MAKAGIVLFFLLVTIVNIIMVGKGEESFLGLKIHIALSIIFLIATLLAFGVYLRELYYSNPKYLFGYRVNNASLQAAIYSYISERLKVYRKDVKKTLSHFDRSSETFTSFEKEKLGKVGKDIDILCLVCLAANHYDVTEDVIKNIFKRALLDEIGASNYELELIVGKGLFFMEAVK